MDGRNHLLAHREEKSAQGVGGTPVGWAGSRHRRLPSLAALGLANVSWVWFNFFKKTCSAICALI